MTYLEVLCEGSSDVPALREVLTRRLGLNEGEHFRIHPHRGKGKLPAQLLARPNPGASALLDLLPIKLRNYGKQAAGQYETAVLVVVDADREDCKQLKNSLVNALDNLDHKPQRVLFCIAVEETESWFIADTIAVKKAYSHANIADLKKIPPDAVCNAWECLAKALGLDPQRDADKSGWATAIAPHLDLEKPKSPSLKFLINQLPRLLPPIT